LQEYPELDGLIITPDDKTWTEKSSLDAMDAGKCYAAITSEETMNIEFMEKETHCKNKMRLPQLIVTSLDESVPFHAEHLKARANERALSFHTLNAVYTGKLGALKAKESQRKGLDGCSTSDSEDKPNQLNTDHFFGLFLLLVSFSVILPIGLRMKRISSEKKSFDSLSESMKKEKLREHEKQTAFTQSQFKYAHLVADVMATQFAVDMDTGKFVKVARDGSTHQFAAEERRLFEPHHTARRSSKGAGNKFRLTVGGGAEDLESSVIDQQSKSSRASFLRLPTEMEAPPDDAESAVVLPEKDLENLGAESADSGPFPIPEVIAPDSKAVRTDAGASRLSKSGDLQIVGADGFVIDAVPTMSQAPSPENAIIEPPARDDDDDASNTGTRVACRDLTCTPTWFAR
jgi:hypothetical protein